MEALAAALLAILLDPAHLGLIVLGTAVGIVFGVMPGLQNLGAMALALPFTYALAPSQAFVLLTSIYCAGIYGGSITAILYRIPGSPENAATAFDGYPMTERGEAAKALGTAIFASAFGGLVSATILVLAAPRVAPVALAFGPAEYCAVIFFAIAIVALMGRSLIKGVCSALFGFAVASVGIAPVSGGERFTFGLEFLLSGFDFVALMLGVFAMAEVLSRAEREVGPSVLQSAAAAHIRARLPRPRELLALGGTLLRSTGLGAFIGLLPALGATVAAFLSYDLERRVGRERERMGTGVPSGVAAPESAKNASTGGAMILLLTLGIPGSAGTALILGAFEIHGLRTGEALFRDESGLLYLIFAAMLLANLLILAGGLAAVPLFARLARLRFAVLAPLIVVLCALGAYMVRNSMLDVWSMFGFGVVGYAMERFGFSIPAFVLAFVLGPLAEASLLRSMLIFDNDPTRFLDSPLAAIFIGLGVVVLLSPLVRRLRAVRPRPRT